MNHLFIFLCHIFVAIRWPFTFVIIMMNRTLTYFIKGLLLRLCGLSPAWPMSDASTQGENKKILLSINMQDDPKMVNITVARWNRLKILIPKHTWKSKIWLLSRTNVSYKTLWDIFVVLGAWFNGSHGQVLDGAGGLQGWMERVENLPGVSFSESFIPDPTNLIGT